MRSASAALDHLVLATPDLLATARRVEDSTGVLPSIGGVHPGRGTRNMLCSLGASSYLEIVGPDADQEPPPRPRPFGIDDLVEAGLVAWAVRVDDIGASAAARRVGFDPGEDEAMERRRPDGIVLRWRLTVPRSATVPFLIDWLDSPHPAATAAPGLVLESLSARDPDPAWLSRVLEALDIEMTVDQGPAALVARLRGPRGELAFP
jgi:hypothetical protein